MLQGPGRLASGGGTPRTSDSEGQCGLSATQGEGKQVERLHWFFVGFFLVLLFMGLVCMFFATLPGL